MKITPVDNYKSPNIPTRDYVDDNPEILNNIPNRWMSDAVVLTALAGTVMLISAARNCTAQQYEPAPKVAPIFNWGDGRGTYGCDIVVPPTFLSEEEAKEVITKEAASAGIIFNNKEKPFNRYGKPAVQVIPSKNGDNYPRNTFLLDGSDETRHINFEFVSLQDAGIWDPYMNRSSSVSVYSTKRTARYIRSRLWLASEDGIYVTFYDPLAPMQVPKQIEDQHGEQRTNTYKEAAEKAKAESKDLLRSQVKDFIKWLKSEGVI
jgi:hypothetical protein